MQIDRHDADVDRFDDVLVEVFQAFVFVDFLFERGIQAGILYGDTDISSERFEQLDVFTGKKIAVFCFAQAQERDRFLLGVARDVIVQVEPPDGFLCAGIFAR